MSLDTSILNTHGHEITKIYGRKHFNYEARFIGKISWPYCGNTNLRKKNKYTRNLNNESIGSRITR